MQRRQGVCIGRKLPICEGQDLVRYEIKWPLRCDPWIKLEERAGRGVAGIRERLSASFEQLTVELREAGDMHQHFAPHGEQWRHLPFRVTEAERHGANRLDIVSNVFAFLTIPACHCALQASLFIHEFH